MLKGQKKHIGKEQGKTKHEAPHSANYRATQNKNNIGTSVLERSVVYTTGGFKGLLIGLFRAVWKYSAEQKKCERTCIRDEALNSRIT